MQSNAASSAQVVVAGCCFLDYKTMRLADGSVARSVHHGGVGRNLAENLGWCGVDVGFITMAQPGTEPREMFLRLARAGVRIAALETERGVGEFHAELDPAGNLVHSFAKIPQLEKLDWRFISRRTDWLSSARWIVFETGLDGLLLEKLMNWANWHRTPVCALPTRLLQTGPRWQILRHARCLILNHYEAAHILEMQVETAADAKLAIERFLNQGIPRVVITMGAQGVVAAHEGAGVSFYPAPPAQVVDSTGAGDALAAALIASLVNGESFSKGIAAGLELARQTVESHETVITLAATQK